jgi:hypothetical protein
MGANDAAEMLRAAQAEVVRLERALIAIRDLMEPERTAEAYATIGYTPHQKLTVSPREIYAVARTQAIRQALADAGYPVRFTPEQADISEQLRQDLAEQGVCLACGGIIQHFPFCTTTKATS